MEKLLEKMQAFYKVLEVNGERIQTYRSLYFDTEDRKFYIDHHNSRVNRNKIRFREYVSSGLTFLEVKLKNNKGKTIKKRIKVAAISEKLSQSPLCTAVETNVKRVRHHTAYTKGSFKAESGDE